MDEPIHNWPGPDMVTAGGGWPTVTSTVSLTEQGPSVAVTVYVVVLDGDTVIEAVVSPVLHKNAVAPDDAVSTIESPLQMLSSGPASTVGKVFTFSVT